MLQWKIFSSKWVLAGWLLFISILFVLPGSAIPRESWFSKIYLDKWVHIIFFAVLVFLWLSVYDLQSRYYIFIVLLFALSYGILVEFVQELWVPNRNFDVYDILADLAGSVVGLFVWFRGIKNKPL